MRAYPDGTLYGMYNPEPKILAVYDAYGARIRTFATFLLAEAESLAEENDGYVKHINRSEVFPNV